MTYVQPQPGPPEVAGPRGWPPAFPEAPSPGTIPATPGSGYSLNARRMLSLIGVGAFIAGLAVAISPFGVWYWVNTAIVGAGITGYGHLRVVGGRPGSASLNDDVDWILGTIPDGVPVGGLGIVLASAGLMLLLRSRYPARDAGDNRTQMLVAAGALVVGPAVGILWTGWSWIRADNDFQRDVDRLKETSPLFSAYFADLHLDPGFGMIFATVALMGIGLLGVSAFVIVVAGSASRDRTGQQASAPPPGGQA